MSRTIFSSAVLCLLSPFVCLEAEAHDVGIVRVNLTELASGEYAFSFVRPTSKGADFGRPIVPTRCDYKDGRTQNGGRPRQVRYLFACDGMPLSARDTISVEWPREGVSVAMRWLDGTQADRYFQATGSRIVIPMAELLSTEGGLWLTAKRYTELGVEHIVFGVDHLLFVLGLLLFVTSGWALARTVTAFTIAHSITLALATFGVLAISSLLVEALIALSIIFLAVEYLEARKTGASLTAKHTWVVAFAFGLLHGLGFAGALGEIGIPQSQIPVALAFFNIGVELGQLAFVFFVVFLAGVLKAVLSHANFARPRWNLRVLTSYSIGSIACYWFMDRVALMLPS